jgi:methylenetetrahydrofolate reductase (NADPH)
MHVNKLETALQECKKAGIRNILALRGDPPAGEGKFTQIEGGFACALDLVKYIREQHGEYFGICVAGYPEAHPDKIDADAAEMKKNYWADIAYLKKKVAAGADFVITQLFYDVDAYLQFVKDCRSVGIYVPILPGIMPIANYAGFKRMTAFCKTRVPAHIADTVEALKDHEEALKLYGISLGTMTCERLLAAGVPGLHMYTLNLDRSAVAILKHCGLISASLVPAASAAVAATTSSTTSATTTTTTSTAAK